MIRTSFVKKGCYAYLFTANYIEMKIGKSKDLGNPDLLHAIVFLLFTCLNGRFTVLVALSCINKLQGRMFLINLVAA